jgi:acylpyruvate hydrolase
MKVICIGRNYAAHVKEFDNVVPEEPIFFLKTDTSIITRNRPFFIPDFFGEIEYETEIVLKINRVGKNIQKKFAHRYFREITTGIDFTARDLQRKCIKNGRPWEMAKAFEGSAPLGKFVHKDRFDDIHNLEFSLRLNDQIVQTGHTRDMVFSFEDLIAYVSRFFTLKMGDLIFTGTPSGVGSVSVGDRLTASIQDKTLLDFQVK